MKEVSSPEVEELVKAFKAMSDAIKNANMNLRIGNLSVARKNYINAMILFKKLEDERQVKTIERCIVESYHPSVIRFALRLKQR